MRNRYSPGEISLLSTPVTAGNRRNANRHPGVDLGICTPSQLLDYAGVDMSGNMCIIGDSSRGISFLTPMIRRASRPFLIIGPDIDRHSAFMALEPEWIIDSVQDGLPGGNGAIFLSSPCSSYLNLCQCLEKWSREYFIILDLRGGVQAGPELLNLLSAAGQCVIFCDSVPQALRNTEARTVTAKEFMSQMRYLLVYSAGVSTRELIDILPTYQFEKVTNTTTLNSYKGRAFFHPFRGHKGLSGGVSQARTTEYKKSLYEMDELQRIFDDGTALLYNARTNVAYLSQIV